jgi:hypothetical protein
MRSRLGAAIVRRVGVRRADVAVSSKGRRDLTPTLQFRRRLGERTVNAAPSLCILDSI